MAAHRKSFGSDNHAGVHPAVLRAIADANPGDAVAYGADAWTGEATAGLREAFGADEAFLVLNGSGANVLGLSLLLRRHEAVICAESAHINTDECGAPEQLVGTKLLTVPTADGKITPELIAEKLSGRGDDHRSRRSSVGDPLTVTGPSSPSASASRGLGSRSGRSSAGGCVVKA